MDYDYEEFEMIITAFLNYSEAGHDGEQVIGENISCLEEVKIIFDGYGDLETTDENGDYEYVEGGNVNMQSYAIFIHRDALTKDFVFPEHTTYSFTFGNMIQHRPKEEICIYAWYDLENDSWEIIPLEDRIDKDCVMNEEDVMKILKGLYEKYFS